MKRAIPKLLLILLAVAAVFVARFGDSTFRTVPFIEQTGTNPVMAPSLLLDRVRVDLTTTAATSRLSFPDGLKIVNWQLASQSGGATATLDNNTLFISGNTPGSQATARFEFLLTTDGVSDTQWQLNKASGLTASHVDIININDSNNPVPLAEADNANSDGSAVRIPISGRAESRNGPVTPGSPGPKKVFAIYVPWWATVMSKWSESEAIDNPAELYTTLNQTDVNRIVGQAAASGVDGFLASWQGEGHFADRAFQVLLNAADQNPGFTAAAYIETGVANKDHTYNEPPDLVYLRRWITDMVQNYSANPAYQKMNGKPVIYIYRARYFTPDVWKRQVFDPLRAQGIDAFYVGDYVSWDHVAPLTDYLAAFDGLHSYNPSVFQQSAPLLFASNSGVIKTYSLLQDTSAPRKVWMGTAVPGFDTTHIDSPGTLIPRDSGNFYRFMWDANLANDPDWMMVSTWNDYGENTYIEPSHNYGSMYLDITRDYITQFKGTAAQPQLVLSAARTYWSDFPSYQSNRLSVDLVIHNTGPGHVVSAAITDAKGSNGVAVLSLPPAAGVITSGTDAKVTLEMNVPAGVSSFMLKVRAQERMDDGSMIYYPGPGS
ncbi:MAG: endo-1,3-alpha-glucanase family glycosylhydrolase [Thermoleophilia bacterium]